MDDDSIRHSSDVSEVPEPERERRPALLGSFRKAYKSMKSLERVLRRSVGEPRVDWHRRTKGSAHSTGSEKASDKPTPKDLAPSLYATASTSRLN